MDQLEVQASPHLVVKCFSVFVQKCLRLNDLKVVGLMCLADPSTQMN